MSSLGWLGRSNLSRHCRSSSFQTVIHCTGLIQRRPFTACEAFILAFMASVVLMSAA